jgi:hypothetical protein
LKGDICIIFDALKKLEDNKDQNVEENEVDKKKKQKLVRQYKKLEEAFGNLSLDVHD